MAGKKVVKKKPVKSGKKSKTDKTIKSGEKLKTDKAIKNGEKLKTDKTIKNGKKIKTDKTVKISKKSETIKAVERKQKLEDTLPMGNTISQLTSELPILGKSLDGPDLRPWKKVKIPKPQLDIKGKRLLIILSLLLITVIVTVMVILHAFKVDTVTIEGNTHYSNEEIYDIVMGDRFGDNSLYLSMKYKNRDIEGIPFIQTMNVNIVNPHTIRITVYEKAMAGFVEYMGRYFYFDKDGTVIESSDVKTKGIPQVLGLTFDHIVLYEKLPVESREIFGNILEMTQLLNKYDIEMDKIYFDKNYNMTLYFGQARIKVGDFTNIDEKIIRLKDILPELADKKGVLRLDNYSGDNGIITFEVDS